MKPSTLTDTLTKDNSTEKGCSRNADNSNHASDEAVWGNWTILYSKFNPITNVLYTSTYTTPMVEMYDMITNEVYIFSAYNLCKFYVFCELRRMVGRVVGDNDSGGSSDGQECHALLDDDTIANNGNGISDELWLDSTTENKNKTYLLKDTKDGNMVLCEIRNGNVIDRFTLHEEDICCLLRIQNIHSYFFR